MEKYERKARAHQKQIIKHGVENMAAGKWNLPYFLTEKRQTFCHYF